MTKLYLHNAASSVGGTLPSTEQSSLAPDSNFFTGVTDADNKSMDTTKSAVSQSNLTNASTADANPHNYYIMKWVSPLIYQAKVSAQTWSFEYAAKESNAAANFPVTTSAAGRINCYVWKPSDGTKVGTILDGNTSSISEAGTSQTVISGTFTGAEVTGIQPGNAVIVFELWAIVTQGNGTQRTQDIYYDGTTENSTTNEAAFISTPENLIFTPTDGNASMIGSGSSVTSTANTTQYLPIIGDINSITTTENDVKVRFREAGTLSNLVVRLSANSIAGSTTFTVMKGGNAQSLVATATASTAGVYEDVTNTVSVAAGDDIDIKSVPGAASGTFTIVTTSLVFTPTDPTRTVQLLGCAGSTNFSTASTTSYIVLHGSHGVSSTEANGKIKQRKAGTYAKLYVYVSANARTTNTTFKSRKNGADGNLTVTYASGETGVKEDTSHSDTVAAGDDYNFAITSGTGTETITYKIIKVEFASTTYEGIISSGNINPSTFNAATTYNWGPYTNTSTNATEDFRKSRVRVTRMLISNLHVNVVANTVSASSTLKLRVNGVDTALSVTITSNTAGVYTDTTNIINVGSNDDIGFQLICGATGTSMTISSVTAYYNTGRISLSRSYLYNLLGRISLSRIYLYNIVSRISLSRIYKYHVLGRISLSRIYKYHLQARVSLSRIYKYHLQGRISLSRIYKYHVQARVSLSRIYKYHVANYVSLSRIYKYNIFGRVSLSRIYKYHLIGRISLSSVLKYHVVGRISLSRIYKYNILERISLSRIYKYHVANLVSLSRTYKYNVQSRISLSLTLLYNVIGRVSLSRIYKYNIIGRISLARTYLYNIQARVSLSRIYKYNVLARISLSTIYKYHIQGRVSLAQIYKYHVQSRVSLARTYLWDIVVSELTRVSKPQVYLWNVQARVSLSRTYLYNVIARVSLSRIYKYHIQSRISLSQIYKYNLIGRVSLARVYKYNIMSRISLSRSYVWNVLARVSLSRIYKWDITALARVSKEQIYKWNVIGRVSLLRIYKYHVLNRVTLSRIYKYNILNRVSVSVTYLWNMNQRITLPRIYRYNVIGRISLTRTYKWNLTVYVSKSQTYLWNITNRVSKSITYKYNILQTISSSIRLRWNIAFDQSKRNFRGLIDKVEGKKRYPKSFSRIRSSFYRPEPTKHPRNSKYRRG